MRAVPLLVLLLGPAAAAAGLPVDATELSCGDLAPFVNACEACCATFRGQADLEAHVLGYVGDLEVRLRGEDGSWKWRCSSLGASAVTTCTGPTVTGDGLKRGEDVRLVCKAWPHAASMDAAPPTGPWGCVVQL